MTSITGSSRTKWLPVSLSLTASFPALFSRSIICFQLWSSEWPLFGIRRGHIISRSGPYICLEHIIHLGLELNHLLWPWHWPYHSSRPEGEAEVWADFEGSGMKKMSQSIHDKVLRWSKKFLEVHVISESCHQHKRVGQIYQQDPSKGLWQNHQLQK